VLDGAAALFSGSPKVVVDGSFNGGHNLNFHFDGEKAFESILTFVDQSV
jgi:hypothetical protein